jgi:hypothetical protein
VLEGFSQSVSPFIDSDLNQEGSLLVNNETAHLYRFWDATAFAEYLYDCIAETIRTDLKQEIGFLKVFDAGHELSRNEFQSEFSRTPPSPSQTQRLTPLHGLK